MIASFSRRHGLGNPSAVSQTLHIYYATFAFELISTLSMFCQVVNTPETNRHNLVRMFYSFGSNLGIEVSCNLCCLHRS